MANRLIARLKSLFGTSGAPFYGFGELGGQYPFSILGDGWQKNISLRTTLPVAAYQASVAAYVHAFELMPATHRRADGPCGGSIHISSSALSRWLRNPNGFQTSAEFWGMGIRSLYEQGNAVAALARNDRNEIVGAVWVSHYSYSIIDGELIYSVSYSNTPGELPDAVIPARDILHLRINPALNDPLRGRSPVVWCTSSMSVNATLGEFLRTFLQNRASPSYVLTTDLPLTKEALDILRKSWESQAATIATGGTPILSNGLKPAALGVAPGDDLLVQTFNLTVEDIARAFSIPKALIGIAETASNAEQLMRAWVSLGLGSVIETVEQAIARAFRLPPDDWVNFDHNALLRLDAAAQMTTVKEGVTGGILSADEGRAVLGYPPIHGGFGAMPTMQQQQIPIDMLHAMHAATIAAKLPSGATDGPDSPAQEPPDGNRPPHPGPDGEDMPPDGPQANQRGFDADSLALLINAFNDRGTALKTVIASLQEDTPTPDPDALRGAVNDLLNTKRATL